MANFDTSATKRQAVRDANNLLEMVLHVYTSSKEVARMLQLLQSGSDPAFNAALAALFTTAEKAELNAMAVQINALILDWETAHRGAIGLAP